MDTRPTRHETAARGALWARAAVVLALVFGVGFGLADAVGLLNAAAGPNRLAQQIASNAICGLPANAPFAAL